MRIKELREIKNINQEQLAKEIGVRNYTVGNWEQNRSEPNIEQLKALATYFDKSIDYIVGYKNEIAPTLNQLTDNEVWLLQAYNKLSAYDQDLIIGFAKRLLLNQ